MVEAAEQATTYPSCYQPDSAIAIVIGIGLAIATFLSYLPQVRFETYIAHNAAALAAAAFRDVS